MVRRLSAIASHSNETQRNCVIAEIATHPGRYTTSSSKKKKKNALQSRIGELMEKEKEMEKNWEGLRRVRPVDQSFPTRSVALSFFFSSFTTRRISRELLSTWPLICRRKIFNVASYADSLASSRRILQRNALENCLARNISRKYLQHNYSRERCRMSQFAIACEPRGSSAFCGTRRTNQILFVFS